MTVKMIFSGDQSDLGLRFFFKVKISANLRGSAIRLRESSRNAFSETNPSAFLSPTGLAYIDESGPLASKAFPLVAFTIGALVPHETPLSTAK